MRRFFFLFVIVVSVLTACNNKLTAEQAESAVMQGEKERLPLLLQNLIWVDDITIDSIHLNVTEEPMQGFLYTTWISGKDSKSIIVQIDSICTDESRKDYIQWQSHWDDAAKAYVMKSLGF
jgi:hypothetical protein